MGLFVELMAGDVVGNGGGDECGDVFTCLRVLSDFGAADVEQRRIKQMHVGWEWASDAFVLAWVDVDGAQAQDVFPTIPM